MSDIIERLRNYIPGENDDDVPQRIAEAIAEIEKLREALRAQSPTAVSGGGMEAELRQGQESTNSVSAANNAADPAGSPARATIRGHTPCAETEATHPSDGGRDKYEWLREKLAKVAAFDDELANLHLKMTGSYGEFDEPASVKIAREILSELPTPGRGGGARPSQPSRKED